MSDTTYVDFTTPAVNALWLNEINDHVWHDTPVAGTTVHDASVINNTPAGGIVATNVQAAITELDTDKIAFTRLDDTDGSSLVGFIQAGAGAVPLTAQAKMREIISVKDFGASAAASAATNLAAFKLAVAATTTGGTLYIPADSGNYIIDATGGLSTSIVVDRSMTLVFEGNVESNFSTMQANPPYLFKVTGEDVCFKGVGTFVGNGTFDVTNAGDETTFPGFIYVTGGGFTCSGLNFRDAPKLSILLYNCVRAHLTGNKFSGGPATDLAYGTGYFGIRATGGSAHRITENWFGADAGGGKISNCIFFGGSQGNVSTSIVAHNVLSDSWEKLVYGYMDRCVISDNSLNYPNGNKSDAIRVMNGAYNVIDGNTIIGANGGVSIYDSVATKVRNNQIVGCKQVGIYCRKMTALPAAGFSDTEIIGNYVLADIGSLTLGDGISIVSDGQTSSRVKVVANSVIGFGAASGEANIRLVGLSPQTMDDCVVVGNIIDGSTIGNNGVWLGRGVNCRVSDNTISRLTNVGVVFDGCFRSFIDNNNFRSPGLYAIDLNGGAQSDSCTITDNASRLATNVGIADFSTTNVGRGNSYTDAFLTSSATLTNASATTVVHGGVAPNAIVFLQESNSTAGNLTAITGLKTSLSGTNFVIETSNGGAAVGTEILHYNIVQ